MAKGLCVEMHTYSRFNHTKQLKTGINKRKIFSVNQWGLYAVENWK